VNFGLLESFVWEGGLWASRKIEGYFFFKALLNIELCFVRFGVNLGL
jgi:hypothetical protein